MGEEVKITVIATGFRDQLPERRARMLTVEEAPVVSVPLASVPVSSVPLVASDKWLRESASASPRFFSQDEEAEVDQEDAAGQAESDFFSTSASSADSADAAAPLVESVTAFAPREKEVLAAPAPPKFAELSEAPAYTPLPRDYASAFSSGVCSPGALDECRAQSTVALISEADEDAQPDLEKPAFLRRLQF
jgi:cell division protein FtsZ